MVCPHFVKSSSDIELTPACISLLFPGGERNLEPVCLLSEAEHGLGGAKEVGGC